MQSRKNGKFELSTLFFKAAALLTAIIIVFFVGYIFYNAYPTVSKMGINFFTTEQWNPDLQKFGIFDFIVGTITLTVMTMIMSCPVGILTAIYLAEYAPRKLESVMRSMIELLVGIPSVVYGVFGFFVIRLLLENIINPQISNNLGFISIFSDNSAHGVGLLLASIVLAIMILPVITVLTEDALRALPPEYKEASLSLGSTRWEYIKKVAIPASVTGLTTALLLGLMRAMGETMAVVMLTGNSTAPPTTIFQPIFAMTSKILNEVGGDRGSDIGVLSALFGLAATLFAMEIAVIFVCRLINRRAKNT
jgi:phosphate transport system permease protein